MNFNFLPQAFCVKNLLEICGRILPQLQEKDRAELEVAMCEFEKYGQTIFWSLDDVKEEESRISQKDALIILENFLNKQECLEENWLLIKDCRDELLENKITRHAHV